MNALGGDVVYNHADFRLMSRRTLQALMAYPERNLFLRGMVSALGYPSARVYYDRKERMAGESKYPLSKMLSFALDGITSFSVRPLRYISMLGLLFILISLVAIVYGIVVYVEGNTIPGWTSLLVSVWFIGGTILMALGIIGEYVGKIYKEVKRGRVISWNRLQECRSRRLEVAAPSDVMASSRTFATIRQLLKILLHIPLLI